METMLVQFGIMKKNANRIQASKDLLEYYRYTNPRWKKWYDGKIKE